VSGSTGRYELRRRRAKISGCLQGSTVDRGLAKPGFLANTLTPSVGDGNSNTPEFKSFLVNVEKA